MSNTYFQFKQFKIDQDQCAMKVSTEACILGAWVPDIKPQKILDIGTGTGLLALMLAQRLKAPVDAVELDQSAAIQARHNAAKSPWAERIQVIQDNVFDYADKSGKTYDLIVSNPPFFSGSLKSESENKNRAKHDTTDFDKKNLAQALTKLLSEDGRAFILYPELETNQFSMEAEIEGLLCKPALIIRNQPNGPIFRIVSVVSRLLYQSDIQVFNIRNGKEHTKEFEALLNTYYLKL